MSIQNETRQAVETAILNGSKFMAKVGMTEATEMMMEIVPNVQAMYAFHAQCYRQTLSLWTFWYPR